MVPVVAGAKEFSAGATTGLHSHVRAQFIFAIRGLMVATTDAGTWLLPPGYALWLPAGISHDVAMHGAVSMRTAYLRAEDVRDLPRDCRIVARAAIAGGGARRAVGGAAGVPTSPVGAAILRR